MTDEVSLQKALQELYDREGRLTAELVVREAEDGSSPLHRYFEWDDSSAGRKFRLFQARALIRRITIKVERAPDRLIKVRAYTHVPEVKSYLQTPTALERHHDLVMRQARAALQNLRRRYQDLVDFESLLREELSEGRTTHGG